MDTKTVISRILPFLIIITLLFAIACGNGGDKETTISSPTTAASTALITTQPTLLSTSTTSVPSLADIIAAVYPSVVTINTQSTSYSFFYGRQVQEGAGSGWIYGKDGVIVTNNHVVEGAQSISVGLADGRAFEAKKVYADPISDLAVLRIDANDLPALPVGDSSELRVGDWLIAIGNPLGQGLRAKEGIVSGLNVSLSSQQGESLFDLIETSAAINPGNSGGPLVNLKGEVIGITSAKISEVGVEGMGYAISSRTALPVIQELIDHGYVTRPWLGAELVTVDRYVAMVNRLSVNSGAAIAEITKDSPADKAGLQVRDVITKFDGETVTDADGLNQMIHARQIGDSVEITYVRGNKTRTATVQLVASPKP